MIAEFKLAAIGGGSPDPALNMHLSIVLRKARVNGVPKDNVEKALARVRLFLNGPAFQLTGLRLQISRNKIP